MGWSWAYEDEAGQSVVVDSGSVSQVFPTQSEAESWLGETWRSLADSGVAAVTLKEESRVVYGPMSLSPASPE